MKYSATSQRQLILIMAFIAIVVSISNWESSNVKWVSLTIFSFCVLLAFLKYTLFVNEQSISYTVQLFGLTIYRKEMRPSDIKKILFKRIGWNAKLAAIKLHKGIPIRVSLFKPENVYDELLVFCEENAVSYYKAKDYQVIQKMR